MSHSIVMRREFKARPTAPASVDEDGVRPTPFIRGKRRLPSSERTRLIRCVLEVWPESHWPGFALRQADVFQSYAV